MKFRHWSEKSHEEAAATERRLDGLQIAEVQQTDALYANPETASASSSDARYVTINVTELGRTTLKFEFSELPAVAKTDACLDAPVASCAVSVSMMLPSSACMVIFEFRIWRVEQGHLGY